MIRLTDIVDPEQFAQFLEGKDVPPASFRDSHVSISPLIPNFHGNEDTIASVLIALDLYLKSIRSA
jgi:hypothetical protein